VKMDTKNVVEIDNKYYSDRFKSNHTEDHTEGTWSKSPDKKAELVKSD
jgi:hypothetical protein